MASPVIVESAPPATAPGSISDQQSLTESSHTSSSIISKSKSLKKKLKHKLHLDHHAGDENDDEDGEDYTDEDNDGVEGNAVHDGGVTPHASANRTAAQAYADSHAAGGDPYFAASSTPAVIQRDTAAVPVTQNTQATPISPPQTPAKAASIRSHAGSVSLPNTQSDWKRRAEFHNLFEGQVDKEEHLVSDYTCAWSKDILRHGRIYVGAQNLAFICTILGLKCSVVIPFSDITSFEKTVTARVIPNAIAITTKEGDIYTFCSFLYRDTTYDLLVECWKSINSPAYDSFISSQSSEMQTSIDEKTEASPFPTENAAPVTEHKAHPATQCSGGHFKEIALDVRFPSEPEKIFNLLYRNEDFMKQLCDSQKLTKLEIKPWGPASKPGMEKRDFSYLKPLNGSVGPSSAMCYITDEELVKDPEGAFEVLSITKTPDVPSGGSFEIHTKSCLTWAGGAKGGARMLVTTECVWSGRSMIKGIVTSASVAGQREYNKGLAKSVRKHIQAHPAEYASGDVNAPEADDEIGTDDTAEASNGNTVDEKSTPAPGLLGVIGRAVQQNELAAAILVLSNLVLLIAFLVNLFKGDKAVKITKAVLTEQAEIDALARLQRLEASWEEFRKAIDILAART